MKVIAGIYKGRNIDTIKDTATRPMMGIAREGIFNALQSSFENAEYLLSVSSISLIPQAFEYRGRQ